MIKTPIRKLEASSPQAKLLAFTLLTVLVFALSFTLGDALKDSDDAPTPSRVEIEHHS